MPKRRKIAVLIVIILIILLAVIMLISKGIIKLNSKNNIAMYEENIQTKNEPNIPRLSAGMIPIKWDEEYECWRITRSTDANWYDYENEIPAYIMLNDGTYKSEAYYNMPSEKTLAENNIGLKLDEEELGSIYMWVPRFVVNTDTEEIEYLEQERMVVGNLQMQDIFTYKTEGLDYSLAGVWVEVAENSNAASVAANMNTEENNYGFIKNTKANTMTEEEKTTIEKFINNIFDTNNTSTNNVGATSSRPQIESTNHIILKIVDTNKPEPIKASIDAVKGTGVATIIINYIGNGLNKIKDDVEKEITQVEQNGKIILTVTVTDESAAHYYCTIVDNENNEVALDIAVREELYANYNNGILTFSKSNEFEDGVTYKNIAQVDYTNKYTEVPWYNERTNITKVVFKDEVKPISTANWFYGCSNLSVINYITYLNTSSVISMEKMFYCCYGLTGGMYLSNFDTSNVTNMSYMFYDCSGLTSITFGNSFNTSKVTNMSNMFSGCSGLTSIDVSKFNTSNVTNMSGLFGFCSGLTSISLSNFNTSNVTDMSNMFQWCSKLKTAGISSFNTSKVTNMSNMFSSCSSLTGVGVSNFNTSKVTDMSCMFSGCSSMTSINVSNFNTSNVTNMSSMFSNCNNRILTNINLSNFNTSKVTNMSSMFYNCKKLTSITFGSNFKTNNVTNMSDMFNGCSGLTSIDVSSFNTGKVVYMLFMFSGCSSLTSIDLRSFTTDDSIDMRWMLSYCTNLASWTISNSKWQATTEQTDIFKNSQISYTKGLTRVA